MTDNGPAARLSEASLRVVSYPPLIVDPTAAALLARVFERVGFVVSFDRDMLHRVGNENVLALADHILATMGDGDAGTVAEAPTGVEDLASTAQRIATDIRAELGSWTLSQLGGDGLADAIHNHYQSYQNLAPEEQAALVDAVSEVIYG